MEILLRRIIRRHLQVFSYTLDKKDIYEKTVTEKLTAVVDSMEGMVLALLEFTEETEGSFCFYPNPYRIWFIIWKNYGCQLCLQTELCLKISYPYSVNDSLVE